MAKRASEEVEIKEVDEEIEVVAQEMGLNGQGDFPFGEWSRETVGKKGIKVLLYGTSGSGKTRMAATFPKPLFLDLEGGLRSTLAVGPVMRYPADPIEEITELSQVKKFYSLVKRQQNPPFETIVIDSLNELQLLIMRNVVSQYDANRQYDDQPTMADYGKMARDMTAICRLFLKLPYHVVFTAISTPREYPEQEVYPQFIGKKTGPEIHRMMEMIGYVHTVMGSEGEVQHLVSFEQTPTYVAKDRMGIVHRDIPNDFQSLISSTEE